MSVAGLNSIVRLLPASAGRCGIYVLSFTNGEYYVGQANDVTSRFRDHRDTYPDLAELRFWRVPQRDLDAAEQAEIRRLLAAGLPLRNVTGALGRLGACPFDELVTPDEQANWFSSAPCDRLPNEPRLELAEQRRVHHHRFDKVQADPRFAKLTPSLRRYVAWTIPYPSRTEMSRWAIAAAPSTNSGSWPRLLTLSIQNLETLYVDGQVTDPTQTNIRVNVDQDAVLRRWGVPGRLQNQHPWLTAYEARGYLSRPGVLALEVYRPRDLERLLTIPAITPAARRLNLDLMRKGPTMHWKSHCPDLADVILEPASPRPRSSRTWLASARGKLSLR
jgi:hypothetical protein